MGFNSTFKGLNRYWFA